MVSADYMCDPGAPTRLSLQLVNRRLRAAFTYMGDSDCNTINGCALPASPMLSSKANNCERRQWNMEEIWKDIDGYEGLYQISNLGNVKSLNYRNQGIERILTPKCNNAGRLWVELARNGDRKPMLIHRLVAMAFIPNPNGYPQVNHMDENPKNNHVDNLEWCTALYNIQYSLQRHPAAHTKPITRNEPVIQYTKSGQPVRVWENLVSIRHETGWNDWHIEECCKGNRKTAKGYIWRYASLDNSGREAAI